MIERVCVFLDGDAGLLLLGIATFALVIWSLC